MSANYIIDTDLVDYENVSDKKTILFDLIVNSPNKVEEVVKKPAANGCFNCGGDHSASACPKPRDAIRYDKNLKAFQNRRRKSGPMSNKRYHIEDSSKRDSVKPGVISDKLRLALGIEADEIPDHVYRLREIGYPPSYLNALIESSMKMGESKEEYKVDMSKMVEYPGFNAVAPRHVRNKNCSQKDIDSSIQKIKNDAEKMMRLIKFEKPVRPVKKKMRRTELEDGEIKGDGTDDDRDDNDDCDKQDGDTFRHNRGYNIDLSGNLKPGDTYELSREEDHFSSCKNDKLPDSSNFSKNITPYIPFENLPSYKPGTYKRLKEILKSIKK